MLVVRGGEEEWGDWVGGKRLVVIAGSRERRGSIKEVPVDSETQQTPVKWMVRCKEIVALVRAVYMAHHDKEPA